MRSTGNRNRKQERGAAFFVVCILTLMSVGMVGAFLATSHAKMRDVELQVSEASSFNAAESGLQIAIEDVWTTYKNANPLNRTQALENLDGSIDPETAWMMPVKKLGRSDMDIRVNRVNVVGSDYADVEFVSRGENVKATHTLVAVVRFGRKPSAVFNHAYFINNFGWLWGSGITVNGDVRSNGNFSLSNPVVNGDVWASENEELGAAGTVEGDYRVKDLDWYNAYYGTAARPSNPSAPSEDLNGNGELDAGEDANDNGELDLYEYPHGFDGKSSRKEKQGVIEMPYLGDLSLYKDLARKKGGTLKHGGKVIVDAVLGEQAAEDDDIFLIGTKENPIVIDGPVVVENDVVLKGYVTGRGTIYAGRNVHVIGDIMYLNPPVWSKPMTDLEGTKTANETKDMVGLAAKGSIVLGNYTDGGWLSTTRKYQTPPFTQSYAVDPSDEKNGYVSYIDADGRPIFDGDYRAYDGGKKYKDPTNMSQVSRKFFESSYSDQQIADNSDAQLQNIDAVLYTNHMITGKVGSCVFNGTLVSRDEAIIYHGSLDINYDIRIRDGGYEFIDIYLPREPTYRKLYFGQGLGEIVPCDDGEMVDP
jgi:predicted acyltransferase (DUF342 family)